MTYYAELDDRYAVVAVYEHEGPGATPGWVELPHWEGWPKDAPSPDYTLTWTGQSVGWVDLRTLGEARADAWTKIKAARDAALVAGFTWDGSTFDSDDLSVQRIQGAVQLAALAQAAGQPYSVTWTLADNSTRELSGEDVIQVGLALGSFYQNVFSKGQTLRAQIEAASKDQLASIAW